MKKEKTIRISGPPNNTAKTFLFNQILPPLSNENRVIFWLENDDKETKSIYENLLFWQKLNKKIKLVGDSQAPTITDNIKLLNPENTHDLYVISYMLLRENKPFTIISTFDNLNTIPNIENLIINIRQGQNLNPQTLAQKLTNFGYDRNKVADQKGTFAIRGEIISVWTPQLEKPIKIELDFDKVSKIKFGHQNLKQTNIIPLDFKKSKNQENKKTIEQLSDETMIILSDPEDSVLKKYKTNPKIIFDSLSTIINHKSEIINPPIYHNNLQEFTSNIAKYQNKNYKIIIATNRKKSLKALFKEKNIEEKNYLITQLPNYLITGFEQKTPPLLFLTDTEIFGRSEAIADLESHRKEALSQTSSRIERSESEQSEDESKGKPQIEKKLKTNKSEIQNLKSEIHKGDFVVHEDHGIATFKGTGTHEIDNIKKEFFILEYKDNDKLYAPVELADKIDKYIGLANPPIHRLHGSSWHQITKKIKEQAEKVAKELLDLYAQRKIAHAPAFGPKAPEEHELESSFPFQETPDQLQTIKEVTNDLEQTKPTDRLVCGDVGFGKTEVAVRAAFKAVMNGYQIALLSPTTILAQQHYDTFLNRLKKFPVNVEVLSRFKSKTAQKKVIASTKNGLIDILIGTHRLLSKDVEFKNLGLIIIDEEQRFGVEHKEKLKKLRTNAHILTLTATPIPRTLNFSLAGLRDISCILTPPEGRQKIKTTIKQYEEKDIKTAIEKELARKGQTYFVHNQVETIGIATKKLSRLVPHARFGIAHGQLPEEKLASVMSDFDNKKIDVLVCSTIIENGLDLPNVNTIIIDNATRFGLAQLYQLRGRVGRSDRQAHAFFFYHRLPPRLGGDERGGLTRLGGDERGGGLTPRETARLQALKQAEELGSGFQLALRDMEIRGVGNILGKKQHGSVAAIGLSLYTRLLSNAVEELKTGIKPRPIPNISIDLPLESNIPKEFEPNEPKRLNLYQRLSTITSLNELKKVETQYFASPKKNKMQNIKPLQNLFHLLEIKLLAQQTRSKAVEDLESHRKETPSNDWGEISSIDTSFGLSIDGTRKKRINIKFKTPIDQTQFQKLLSTQPYWKQSNNQIKINLEDLGDNWIEKLKQAIKTFTK
ncbi:DEAD/DEAH box helicase [Candidatus Falkowbacteria bacterium]|nr:DEAD/DEAH box helicase [Candidatus Falkowbacteria bacterium]